MGLSPGDRVDRYEVIQLLGTGGMGEVYRARDPKLARTIALKILRVNAGPGTDGPARLLREARAAAALSHANVLAVFDVGEVQEPEALRGLAYIAMELVVGRNLRSYVGDVSIPLARRLEWLRDVARALGAAHRAGIVHRDVKPENVMIRADDGAVKVLDFGIARRTVVSFDAWSSTYASGTTPPPNSALSTLTGPGEFVGTPYYMAPEQLRGEALDGRADQFAWGVMAYMLVAAKEPWQRTAEPLAVLSQILSFDPPAPRDVDVSVPVAVSDVIVRAMKKRKEDRFETMEALVLALDAKPWEANTERGPSPLQVPPEVSPAASTGISARSQIDLVTSPAPRKGTRWAIGAAVIAASLAAALAWRARAGSPAALAGPSSSAAAGTTAGACSSNRECVESHGGAAWRCATDHHACMELASPDCKVYAGPRDAEAEDVVWFGGMFPLSTDPDLISEMRATELAREDFAQALGPSVARAGALHARPIGLVICDEGKDEKDALRAAHHLVDDVEVPAVIGFRSTSSAVATIPTVLLPKHVLAFDSISQSPAMTKIPEPPGEPRLVWRSTLNHDADAAPFAHLISDVLEPAARTGPHGIGDRPFKVAAVWEKAGNHDFVESTFRELRFNGMSALENGSNFRQFVFGDVPDAGDVVDDILAFGPQVMAVSGSTFAERVLVPLEARWGSTPRPVYTTYGSLDAAVIAFAGRDPTRRRRFFAITNLSSTMTNAQLILRYNLAFPSEALARSEAPQPSYDAFYVLAYAVYALGNGTITGPALSGAIQRLLPPGPKVDVGPARIFDAFQALRSSASAHIDLNGAIGSLDFDPTTGEAPIDYSIVCLGVDDRGATSAPIDSGLVYDSRAKKLVGTLRCP